MKMLDESTDKKIENATVFLTKLEIEQLHSYLGELIENPDNQHFHLSSDDYQKELTVCLYNVEDLTGLHERAKKLIIEDQ